MKEKIYKWTMMLLAVATVAAGTLSVSGCFGFIQAAQESSSAVRQDLDATNSKIAKILEKLGAAKIEYDKNQAEIKKAKESGDLTKYEALVETSKLLKLSGEALWKDLAFAEDDQARIVLAYEGSLERIASAETQEEKWGSIFGSIITVGSSLFGLGGVGGALAGAVSARNAKGEAKANKQEADEYKDGLALTTDLVEKIKSAADPSAWSVIKNDMLSKGDTAALKKIDEVRP